MNSQGHLRTVAQRILSRFNLQIRRLTAGNDLATFLNHLNKLGFRMDVIYDIGANRGERSTSLRRRLAYRPIFVLFEGNSVHQESLQHTGFSNFICLLGDSRREVSFFNIGGTGDSVFPEMSSLYQEVSADRRTMECLDDLVRSEGIPPARMIKLDTQGSELLVLHGSRHTLESTDLLLIEMPVLHYNSGAPMWNEYTEFLLAQDFVPVAVFEEHILSGALVQLDLLFMSTKLFDAVYGPEALDIVRRWT